MSTLQCEIVTPEKKFFASEAEFVVLPGAEGEMGVYENHQPIVTTLKTGSARVTIADEESPRRFAVAGGYAQISSDRVIILADRAVDLADVDKEAVAMELESLQERLADLEEDDPNRTFIDGEIEWNQLLAELA